MSDWIYERAGSTYAPSPHARGPWDPAAQHGGAPAALLAREIERVEPGADMFVARITYEFLGPVPLAPLEADAWIQRPGRRFQVVEAELRERGRTVVRARAARLRRGEVMLPDGALERTEPPCELPREGDAPGFPAHGEEQGFGRTGMEIRFAGGTDYGAGPGLAWFRFAVPLVAGETPTALQRVAAAADFGNGVSRVLEFDRHLFVNTDLTIHLHRDAVGDWVLLDARTVADRSGAGLAASRLFDERGALGFGAQTLFVDTR